MKIQLGHYEFDLSDRYSRGAVLDEAEAKALNITRSERIRNRVARYLDRVAPDKSVLTGEARAELYAWVKSLDESFVFTAQTNVKRKTGTLEAEIRDLARAKAEALARQRGREADAELIALLMEGLLDDPGIEAEAAIRIEARKEALIGALEDL